MVNQYPSYAHMLFYLSMGSRASLSVHLHKATHHRDLDALCYLVDLDKEGTTLIRRS